MGKGEGRENVGQYIRQTYGMAAIDNIHPLRGDRLIAALNLSSKHFVYMEVMMAKVTGIGGVFFKSRNASMVLKAILSVASVLVVCGLAVAANQADPVGTWKCEYNIGDQKRTSTLTIKKDGDKLTGTMSWPDQKEAPLKDIKLKDGELTFSAERVLADNKFNIEYKFMVNGDALKGKGTLDAGGEKRDFDIEGKREK